MYILTPSKNINILIERIGGDFIKFDTIVGACSILPNESGIVVRVLGNSIDKIKKVIHNILDICRQEIIGAKFSGLRKN
jgi:urease accessory protein